MNCFNDVENFIRFLTEAHIVYLVMYLLNMGDIDGQPSQARGKVSPNIEESFLVSVCEIVVDELWCLPSIGDVNTILESETLGDKWCIKMNKSLN